MAQEPGFASCRYLCMAQSRFQNPEEGESTAAGWVCSANLLQLLNTGCSALVIPAFLTHEIQYQLGLCGRDVGVQVISHSCFSACLEDCYVGGWVGLSSNLVSGVIPLHLTLHLCAELLSNTGPLCLLLHCLSGGWFPWIEF